MGGSVVSPGRFLNRLSRSLSAGPAAAASARPTVATPISAAQIALLTPEPALERGQVIAEAFEPFERIDPLRDLSGDATREPRAHREPSLEVRFGGRFHDE